MTAPFVQDPLPGRRESGDALLLWAEQTGRRSGDVRGSGGLRFAFTGGCRPRTGRIR
jgi:hypothetical protein